jgi:hypothetical protein
MLDVHDVGAKLAYEQLQTAPELIGPANGGLEGLAAENSSTTTPERAYTAERHDIHGSAERAQVLDVRDVALRAHAEHRYVQTPPKFANEVVRPDTDPRGHVGQDEEDSQAGHLIFHASRRLDRSPDRALSGSVVPMNRGAWRGSCVDESARTSDRQWSALSPYHLSQG